jgi:mRNA interferase RelE/StbE
MRYTITLSADAQSFVDSADAPLRRKLIRCFEHLEMSPTKGGNIKRLSGAYSKYWRYRVGDYRVIYRVDNEIVEVVIVHWPPQRRLRVVRFNQFGVIVMPGFLVLSHCRPCALWTSSRVKHSTRPSANTQPDATALDP